MSVERNSSAQERVSGPPLGAGGWAVLGLAWVVGLVSWGAWVFLFGYAVWRVFGGSAQGR